MSDTKKNRPSLIAYQAQESGDTTFWHRVGAAWPNRKGGLNIRLTAIPLDGQIILLPSAQDNDQQDEQAGA